MGNNAVIIAIRFLFIAATMAHAHLVSRESTPSKHQSRIDDDSGESTGSYTLLTLEEIQLKLEELAEVYPDFVHMTTAQERYGLATAGSEEDCPFHDAEGCLNFILTIQDFVTHPEGSESSARLPEVYWSGSLHGNERVGPTAVMHAASLLLEAAFCEALPRILQEEELARTCRQELQEKGIDEYDRKWLARLVSTRRIVMTPTTNALGFYRNKRKEESIDPNRDFPYNVENPADCMQTIAARTVNEIFREHMFQLSLTFHAGSEMVAYEWGADVWLDNLSPDDVAQSSIAASFSQYGGGWSGFDAYEYGTMNDIVYPANGGMEDWAYAGSWDPDRVVQCTPESYGGYPSEKTVYNDSTLRVFNLLIETSWDKEPSSADLGNSLNVLSKDTMGNGHISRNIRLALLAVELVEPYVSIFQVNNVRPPDDVVPLVPPRDESCHNANTVTVASNAQHLDILWTVGGSLTIDNTELWYAYLEDVADHDFDCLKHPSDMDGFLKGEVIGATNGTSAFSPNGAFPEPNDDEPNGPIFTGRIPIPSSTPGQIVVYVSARVDQDWQNAPSEDYAPLVGPQSHIANVRTNPDWYHESAGKIIEGRLDWFSRPLFISLEGDSEERVSKALSRHSIPREHSDVRFGNHNTRQKPAYQQRTHRNGHP